MNAPSALQIRATRALYRLHNSGRFVSIARLQRVAGIAYRAGSRALMVLCFSNGNSNGRAL